MKARILAVALVSSSVFAQDLSHEVPQTFELLNGTTYRRVTVARIEPEGVVVNGVGGTFTIPFSLLPPPLRKKYAYKAPAPSAAPIPAAKTGSGVTVKTTDGEIFSNAVVSEINLTGVKITHDGGVSFIPANKLTAESRKTSGMDKVEEAEKIRIATQKQREKEAAEARLASTKFLVALDESKYPQQLLSYIVDINATVERENRKRRSDALKGEEQNAGDEWLVLGKRRRLDTFVEYLANEQDEERKGKALNAVRDCKIYLGMPFQALLLIKEDPYDIHKTVSKHGVSSQWVYKTSPSSANYYYFEDGLLTSIQN